MSQSRLLLGLLLASCSLSVIACAGPTDPTSDEEAESQDELKKKVKPKGGNGAFDLLAPTFNAAGFAGTFSFDNVALLPGERSEKVPGSYGLASQGGRFGDGQLMTQRISYPITAGAVAKHQLSGLRVRFAEPVTLGFAVVDLTPEAGGTFGSLSAVGPWRAAPTGASMLILAGKVGVTPSTEARIDLVVPEGALKEVVLPVSRVEISLDAIDPAYPSLCPTPFVRAGASGATENAHVRKPDGSPNANFVVPQGSRAPVALNTYGFEIAQPTVSGKTNTFTLNRLEIDDVEVAQSGGGTKLVKGTVSMSRKNPDGSFTTLNCLPATHSGVDLPDGTYRIVSSAQSPSGLVTSTEDVTFP